jgi:hypothetical protein
VPLVDNRGRFGMDDDRVFKSVDSQTGDAVGSAVEEPIGCQVRPLR